MLGIIRGDWIGEIRRFINILSIHYSYEEQRKKFKEFVEEAKKDSNVIGFFLSSSRGKGIKNMHKLEVPLNGV